MGYGRNSLTGKTSICNGKLIGMMFREKEKEQSLKLALGQPWVGL